MSKRTPGTRAQSVSQWNTANSHLMPPHGPCPPSSPRWRTHSTPCHPCSIALYISCPSSHPFPCALSAVGLCWKQASGVGHVIPPAAPGASSGPSTRWTCPQRLSEEVSRKNLGRNMLPPQRAGDPTPTYSHCLNKADTEPLGSQVACTRALLSLQLKIPPAKTINVVMNHVDFPLSEVTALIVLIQRQIRPQHRDMYTIFPWMSFTDLALVSYRSVNVFLKQIPPYTLNSPLKGPLKKTGKRYSLPFYWASASMTTLTPKPTNLGYFRRVQREQKMLASMCQTCGTPLPLHLTLLASC